MLTWESKAPRFPLRLQPRVMRGSFYRGRMALRCWWCTGELIGDQSHPRCRGVIDGVDVPREPLADDEPLPVPVWGKYVDAE
jgi:hypothetical protein